MRAHWPGGSRWVVRNQLVGFSKEPLSFLAAHSLSVLSHHQWRGHRQNKWCGFSKFCLPRSLLVRSYDASKDCLALENLSLPNTLDGQFRCLTVLNCARPAPRTLDLLDGIWPLRGEPANTGKHTKATYFGWPWPSPSIFSILDPLILACQAPFPRSCWENLISGRKLPRSWCS